MPQGEGNGPPCAFQFDSAKSQANRVKHGIDFAEALALWLDEDLLRVAARTEDEERFVFVGMIGRRHWSAVVTYRGEEIRIISVRRSRPSEVRAYEGQ